MAAIRRGLYEITSVAEIGGEAGTPTLTVIEEAGTSEHSVWRQSTYSYRRSGVFPGQKIPDVLVDVREN